MAKALKPIVFVLLLLSIVSLILGFLLFGKREVYKESTAKSRSALSEIARNLKFDDFRASDLVVTDPAQFPQMDKSLNLLAAAAQLKTDELETTQQALDVSREERDQARDEANRAIADREAAEDEAARLNQEVAAKSAEVTRQQARLDELQQDKVDLQLQTDELNTKLATVEDELRDVQDQLVTLEQENSDLLSQLGYGTNKQLPKGLTGRVVLVNKDWNFVVINLGSDQGLVSDAEMLIHRGDQLVGKITISDVSRNLAIADLNRNSLQDSVMEGDYVVY
ncbi:MAG: hypothetical protein H7A43_04620 [Verrucomicrobia bacterium]|nr:hypothetical protein [Kiritimatiellia bacterium]MCP5487913.1 hypothetical protein [Verrucomicrobiota bacterium]